MTLSRIMKQPVMQLSIGLLILGVLFIFTNPLNLPLLQPFELYALGVVIALLALGLLFFFTNHSRLMFICFTGCGVMCMYLNDQMQIPLKPELPDTSPSLQMSYLSFDENTSNMLPILQKLEDKQPHLLTIHHQNFSCPDSLARTINNSGYNYHQTYSLGINEQMEIYSKFPFQECHIIQIGNTSSVIGTIAIPSFSGMQELAFIASKFSHSEQSTYAEQHTEHLNFLIEQSKKSNIPLLLLGDYNKAIWSKELSKLRSEADLQVSHRGVLAQAKSDKLPYLKIPTKHIFYSNHLRCIDFESEKIGTSEQFGIFGTYQFVNFSDVTPNVIKTSQKF